MRNPNKMNRQTLQSVQMLIFHVSMIAQEQTYALYVLYLYDAHVLEIRAIPEQLVQMLKIWQTCYH